jgi:hypothetical protein
LAGGRLTERLTDQLVENPEEDVQHHDDGVERLVALPLSCFRPGNPCIVPLPSKGQSTRLSGAKSGRKQLLKKELLKELFDKYQPSSVGIMAAADTSSTSSTSLYSKYPISSAWELTLQDGEVVKGQVYCADPGAGIVVLQDASDIRMVSVASIREAKRTQEASKTPEPTATEITHTKKALEEREKRAIKLAQESIRHLNPKVGNSGGHDFRQWSVDHLPIFLSTFLFLGICQGASDL